MSKEVSKSAFRFSLGTFFSRISGMTREMTMAYVLGTSAAAAAFLVAFRFAYMLRRLFGEGALVNGFIPHYQSLKTKDEKAASFFFRDLFSSLAILLIGLIGVLELGLLFTLHHIAEGNAEIVRLIMLSLPGLLFICLFALHTGYLQCQGRFFLTGAAPIAFNIAWIGTLIFYRHNEPGAITTHLAVALDVAFLFQWAILLPATWKKLKLSLSFRDLKSFTFFSPEIRKMLATLALSVIGVSAIQINGFIDVLFARSADLEGPAYLSYAIRLQQFPLALFGIAIASALFPTLSRALENKEESAAEELLQFGLMRTSCLMIPCTIGIFLLGAPSVNLLFGHGHFTDHSTMMTTICLWAYGLGLLPATVVLLFSQAFYARHDFKTPMFLSLGTIVLHVLFNSLFIFGMGWGPTSVALCTSFVFLINASVLYFLYQKRHGMNFFRLKKASLLRLLFCTMTAAVACLLTSLWLGDTSMLTLFQGQEVDFPHHLGRQTLELFLPFCAFGSVFLAASYFTRFSEVLSLLGSRK